MTDNSLANTLFALRQTPTAAAWEQVLRGAISGGIDDMLDRLGGIEDFIQTTIANAQLPSQSNGAFVIALDGVVSTWQPAAAVPFEELERMLRLISAFTPNHGFHKLLGHLVRWDRFNVTNRIQRADLADLRDIALIALQNYLPVPPLDPAQFPAFHTYVAYLQDCVKKDGIKGHACQRLLELGTWGVDDPRVLDLIASSPDEVIPALLRWLVISNWHSRDAILSRIYGQSVRHFGAHGLFESALSDLGGNLTDSPRGPVVSLPSGDTIELVLDVSDFQQYCTNVLWPLDVMEKGWRKFELIKAEVAGAGK